ncbi:hypothetical protein L0F63_005407, partial [Massospora cicadina]
MAKYQEFTSLQEELMCQELIDDVVPMDQSQSLPDDELEAMKKRVKEMEEEFTRLKSIQTEMDKDFEAPSTEE